MGFKPAMTERQWNAVAKHLPESRRDRVMIEAVLFREFSGRGLAEVSAQFGITRVRLFQWHHAIESELPQIMAVLRLKPASALARSRGGSRHYHRDPAMVAAIAAIRMRNFRDALRGSR